jgi:hypothetical protein
MRSGEGILMQPVSDPIEQSTIIGFLWASRRRFIRGVGIVLLRSLAAAPCTLIIQRIIDRPLKEGRIDGVRTECLFHYMPTPPFCLLSLGSEGHFQNDGSSDGRIAQPHFLPIAVLEF